MIESLKQSKVNFRTVPVSIHTWGKVKGYGPNVYKIGEGYDAMLLERNGWQRVNKGKSYVYMLAPYEKVPKEVVVNLRVPGSEVVMKLAEDLHATGEAYEEKLYGFPVRYLPRRNYESMCRVIGVGLPSGDTERIETQTVIRPAEFSFGYAYTWSLGVYWDVGEELGPRRVGSW